MCTVCRCVLLLGDSWSAKVPQFARVELFPLRCLCYQCQFKEPEPHAGRATYSSASPKNFRTQRLCSCSLSRLFRPFHTVPSVLWRFIVRYESSGCSILRQFLLTAVLVSVWFLLLLLKSWQWKSNIIIMAFLSFLYKMLDHLSVSVLEETRILTLCWLEISLECTTILIAIFLTTTTGLSLLDPHLLSIPVVSFSLIFIACSIKKLLLHINRDAFECDRNSSAMYGHATQVSVMVLYTTTVLI